MLFTEKQMLEIQDAIDAMFISLVVHNVSQRCFQNASYVDDLNNKIIKRKFCKKVQDIIGIGNDGEQLYVTIIKRLEHNAINFRKIDFKEYLSEEQINNHLMFAVNKINPTQIALEIVTAWGDLVKDKEEEFMVGKLTVENWNMLMDVPVETKEEIAARYQNLSTEEKMILKDYCGE